MFGYSFDHPPEMLHQTRMGTTIRLIIVIIIIIRVIYPVLALKTVDIMSFVVDVCE
jgi:hypothetical protein